VVSIHLKTSQTGYLPQIGVKIKILETTNQFANSKKILELKTDKFYFSKPGMKGAPNHSKSHALYLELLILFDAYRTSETPKKIFSGENWWFT